ncbi:MAG: tRNA dimethylallyltransferase [Candidatus Nomurabacteria bacterium]|nr:MAG: tRNA dimethylallyltransferase [Candidatus Nomurabacteria bacterium]
MKTEPLVVIVGPTASGKTSLAIELAEQFNGEVICADSRTVYKGMDIGTAKPTDEERAKIPHWGLDLVEPDQRYTAAEFKKYAENKIREIRDRGNIPFLVGGSGLYVDAVLFDYQFGEPADMEVRQELEALSVEDLQLRCNTDGIELPRNYMNKRHLIRAIEQKGLNDKRRSKPTKGSIVIGVSTDIAELKKRIKQRADVMFEEGVLREAEHLGNKFGWDHESMTGNIYPLCRAYLEGSMNLEEVKEKFIVQDGRLAKKQLTWMRRNQFILWLPLEEARKSIASLLASEQ